MITALDTNVLLDVLVGDARFFETSRQAVERAASAGSVVVCDLVYAELCVHFSTATECDRFLAAIDARVEPLSRDAAFLASRVWRAYRQQGGKRARILADFLIGAHAQLQTVRLLTRDRGFYRRMFPALAVANPARADVISRGGA